MRTLVLCAVAAAMANGAIAGHAVAAEKSGAAGPAKAPSAKLVVPATPLIPGQAAAKPAVVATPVPLPRPRPSPRPAITLASVDATGALPGPAAEDDDDVARSDIEVPKPKGTGSTCAVGKLVRSAFYWQGTHTASGQRFDPDGFTAAHRTLPFGTKVTVVNPRTGKSVEVTVNDRGPYTPGLHIDISRGAARAIGLKGTGTVCLL